MKFSTADNRVSIPANSPDIGDFVAIAALAVVSAIFLMIFYFSGSGGGEMYAEIRTYDGGAGEALRYPLDKDISVEAESRGYRFVIVISDGEILIEEADCPDKVCVHSPAISSANTSVICVPGGLVIRVKAEREDGSQSEEYDYVVH